MAGDLPALAIGPWIIGSMHPDWLAGSISSDWLAGSLSSDWQTGSLCSLCLCRMWTSPPTTSSAPPPLPQTMTSDLHHVTMETFWREVRSIEEEIDGEEEEEEDEEMKSIDGELN